VKAKGKSKMFLPAEKNGLGNIVIDGCPKAVSSIFTVLCLAVPAYVLYSFANSSLDIDGLMILVLIVAVAGPLTAAISLWNYKIIFTDYNIKFRFLLKNRAVKYEDIQKISFASKNRSNKHIGVYDNLGRRYDIPVGGAGTNEIVDLLVNKCGTQCCMKLVETMESIKKSEKAG
jgi:hypothetical protein